MFRDISYFYRTFSFPLLILDSIPFSILKAIKLSQGQNNYYFNKSLMVPLILMFRLDGAIAFYQSHIVNVSTNFLLPEKLFQKLNIDFLIILKLVLKNLLSELLLFPHSINGWYFFDYK